WIGPPVGCGTPWRGGCRPGPRRPPPATVVPSIAVPTTGRYRGHSSGDSSEENLVVKRARVGVVPRWVIEREVLSATPLGSIEARGNGGRRPVGLGQLGFRCAGINP
ncbi:hypothetical protein ACLOJK_024031, partial [Asimina triloba]